MIERGASSPTAGREREGRSADSAVEALEPLAALAAGERPTRLAATSPLPALAAAVALPLARAPQSRQRACGICHGPARPGYSTCWSCGVITHRLGRSLTYPVVPISLYRPGTSLHSALVLYKSSRRSGERAHLSRGIAQLIAWYLSLHSHCMAIAAGGGWDVMTVVPSTRRTDPIHPLASALAHTPFLAQRHQTLLRRGADPVDHLVAGPGAFVATGPCSGRRVLLVDDTFTTGAHARSAAAALQDAGATVVALLVVGRIVHPEAVMWDPNWWDRHTRVVTLSERPPSHVDARWSSAQWRRRKSTCAPCPLEVRLPVPASSGGSGRRDRSAAGPTSLLEIHGC
jgi:predicted amidophosphoribosyltransferase